MADPNEERYGPACRHCGNYLCSCRKSADDAIRVLRDQLYEANTEIARLREALEFYAAADSYEMQNYEHAGVNARQTPDGKWCAIPAMQDAGKRACEALGREKA